MAAGLPNVGTAGTYTKVTTDVKGRVTSGTTLSESDVPTLSTAGKVSGAAINAGIIAGSTSINSSGNLVTTGTVQGSIVGATNLRAFSGANYVQLSAPGGLGGNLNFSLPASDGASGTLMKTNGSGQLSFTALGAADIPALDTGKLTTGTLPVTRGGTGTATLGINSVLLSNATGSAISSLNCASGEVIKFDVLGNAGCGSDTTGSGSQWTTTASDIYYTAGKVGIGTASPVEEFELKKDQNDGTYLRIGNTNNTAAAEVGTYFVNDLGSMGGLYTTSSTFTDSNARQRVILYSSGAGSNSTGVDIRALGAAADIRFLTTGSNPANERMLILANGNVGVGTTTPAAPLDVAGDVKIGNSSASCSSTNKGSIRYDNVSSVLEFCNGTSWNLIQAAACSDYSPNSFTFTDQSNLSPSTLITSDIVQIGGINCSVPVSISGVGSPQYRICIDSGCATVLQDWTSGPSSLTSGQYLQIRQTTDAAGGVGVQANVIVGSGMTIWTVASLGGCTGTQAIGTVCADGTVYAGVSPDAGGVQIFAQRCDFGQAWNGAVCAGARLPQTWNNGITNYTLTGIGNANTGQSNSAALSTLADAGSIYYAARVCEDLNEAGHSDWYLPARNELNVLYLNKAVIRNFDESGAEYWSSTEVTPNAHIYNAASRKFSDGTENFPTKITPLVLRCIRR